MKRIGPNVRNLITRKMSLLAIPPGTKDGLAAGIAAIGTLNAVAREATAWAEQALAEVRAAPDNPYTDDEEIAGEILRRMDELKKRAV